MGPTELNHITQDKYLYGLNLNKLNKTNTGFTLRVYPNSKQIFVILSVSETLLTNILESYDSSSDVKGK